MLFKESNLVSHPREPMGIVIADGGPGDRPSRFAAFVWGPVPDDDVLGPDRAPDRVQELVAAT